MNLVPPDAAIAARASASTDSTVPVANVVSWATPVMSVFCVRGRSSAIERLPRSCDRPGDDRDRIVEERLHVRPGPQRGSIQGRPRRFGEDAKVVRTPNSSIVAPSIRVSFPKSVVAKKIPAAPRAMVCA